MTALKTAPITTGTTKKLSGNGLRGDLDGEGASILSTTPKCGSGLQGLRGRMVRGHRLAGLKARLAPPSTQRHRSPFLSALSDFHPVVPIAPFFLSLTQRLGDETRRSR
jgi:hypothetical protein